MKKNILLISGLLFLTLSTKCASEDDSIESTTSSSTEVIDNTKSADEQIKAYLKTNNLKAEKQASGLYVYVENEGSDKKPTIIDEVTVHYKGYLLDGTVFDATEDTPATFPLANVIVGWQEGIPHFGKGGKGKIIIPPAIGYGSNPSGPIPANSVLVFDIEVVDFIKPSLPKIEKTADFAPQIKKHIKSKKIKGMTETETGLFVKIIKPGSDEKPNLGSFLTLEYQGYLIDGTKFDGTDNGPTSFPFPIAQLIPGWQEGIPMVGKGGELKLIIPPYLGYGSKDNGPIPGNSILEFDIKIHDFSNTPQH